MFVAVVKDKASAAGTVMSLVSSWRPPLRRTVSFSRCLGLDGLAMIHFLVGVFNIGLGPGRPSMHPGDVTSLHAAYWLGAVSIIAGVMTYLSDIGYPCLIIFSVISNIVGACFSIVGIVLYAIDLSGSSFTWMCDDQVVVQGGGDSNCMYLAYIAQDLLMGMDITLIVLMSIQLLVCVTACILLLTGFHFRGNQEDIRGSFRTHQQHMKEVLVVSPAA